jgi:hypothetical protein
LADFPVGSSYDWSRPPPASTRGDVREISHDRRYVVEPCDEGRTIVRVIRSAPATDRLDRLRRRL